MECGLVVKWELVSVFIMGDTSDTNYMSDKYVRLPVFVLLHIFIYGSGKGKAALSRVTGTTEDGISVVMAFSLFSDPTLLWDFSVIDLFFLASASASALVWYVPVFGYF